MKKSIIFTPVFVDQIPERLAERTIYISMKYATATHLCVCGCRNEVVTPFSPTDWQLHFDGDSVSLTPSIGNWQFPCRSHYWIQRNTVTWAPQWSKREIEDGKAHDRRTKDIFYQDAEKSTTTAEESTTKKEARNQRKGRWARLKDRFRPTPRS